MNRSILAAVASLALLTFVQSSHSDSMPDRMMAAQARRLFPELISIDRATQSTETLAMIEVRRRRIDACDDIPECVIAAASWSASESAQLLSHGKAPGEAAQGERQSALAREISGINMILSEYGSGAPPARYPLIDGPDRRESYALFAAKVADAVAIARAGRSDQTTALDPSIGLVLALLDVHGRNDAAAYEPIDQGMNAAASMRARTIDWGRYRYTAIIVPGIGPDDLSTPLSPKSKLHVRMAAQLFAKGDTPFIIVSGGKVHPRGTSFNEAVEMRRALIERFAVPEDSIVVEPYARHTTTNLRNAARRLMSLRAPLDRDAVVVANPVQSRYIESAELATRNQSELGYQPGSIGRRLTPTVILFRPSAVSARVDPSDPLDP